MAAVPTPNATPAMLGRFELRRVLGKGAQATVWLGFDPRLEREVAVKLMRPAAGTDAAAVNQWLQEAQPPDPSAHRAGVRSRHARRAALPRLRIRAGAHACRALARTRRAAAARSGAVDARRARCTARGPCGGRRSSRLEAVERPRRRRRPRAGDGLRHRRAGQGRGKPSKGRRHSRLHVARSGAWRCADARDGCVLRRPRARRGAARQALDRREGSVPRDLSGGT